jgi:hypothetical protein
MNPPISSQAINLPDLSASRQRRMIFEMNSNFYASSVLTF